MWSACTAALLQVKMHHGGGQPCSDKHVKSLDCKTWNASNRKHVARFTLPVVATTRATQVVAAFCTSIDLKFGCKSPIWSPSNQYCQYSMYIYSLLWFCTYNFHTDKERRNQSSPGLETKPTCACGVCTSDFCTFCTLWMHTCSDRIPACEGPHPPPHLEVCPARHHQEPLTSWMLEARASVWGEAFFGLGRGFLGNAFGFAVFFAFTLGDALPSPLFLGGRPLFPELAARRFDLKLDCSVGVTPSSSCSKGETHI